jgi:hypothetical protein
MVKNRFIIPNKKLSLAFQNAFIQQHFPQFRFEWRNSTGIWRGTLQPRDISQVYNVLIKYNPDFKPIVWVTKPNIKPDAPHIYKDKSLCLWWYKEWNWSPDQNIALTLVPWTALWLYYYEIWLDTGEWLAPSAPHNPI